MAVHDRLALRPAGNDPAGHRPPHDPCPAPETAPAAGVTWPAGRFPGVPVWFGRHTGRFWALVHTGRRPRLVEAVTARELATAITNPAGWPWP